MDVYINDNDLATLADVQKVLPDVWHMEWKYTTESGIGFMSLGVGEWFVKSLDELISKGGL